LFERPHHQSVAQVLSALDGTLLRENKCLFGGGTLIALRYGEYRESVDIDFMVSDLAGYRTLRQLLTGKLLANSDRWADDAAFSRDLIDLAMMRPRLELLREAVAKAEHAYGRSILQDLEKAIDRMQNRDGWLERCMLAMAINLPKAQIWQRIRALRRILPSK
jgi:hypothetical protein